MTQGFYRLLTLMKNLWDPIRNEINVHYMQPVLNFM